MKFLKRQENENDLATHTKAEPTMDSDLPSVMQEAESASPRKRPNSSRTERAWQERTRSHQKVNESTSPSGASNGWNLAPDTEKDDLQLAQDLHEFALSGTCVEKPKTINEQSFQNSKFAPRPPKPRRPGNIEHDVAHRLDQLVSGDDYVIDTYIWDQVGGGDHHDPLALSPTGLQVFQKANVGILVVEEDEAEAFWETLDIENGSSPSMASDEEDENGQHNYFYPQ